jgi:hypothetical protein
MMKINLQEFFSPIIGKLGGVLLAIFLLGFPLCVPAAIVSYSASNTTDNLTYTFNYTGTYTWYEVLIDTDQNAATGYTGTGVSDFGADYMLIDNALYPRQLTLRFQYF